MAKGNQGFGRSLSAAVIETEVNPPAGKPILGVHMSALSQVASGTRVDREHLYVDPDRCRMWELHNRFYDKLNEQNCSELIEGLLAQGKQEVPAIVRRLKANPDYDFEVICGARRHWSVSWLKANTYPDFKFLIEIRDLTDEEAFRLSNAENVGRKDLCDYERALDYMRARDLYYGGKQVTMAKRLNVKPEWLSRYLELAKLPKEVVAAFPSVEDIGSKHGGQLGPLLKNEQFHSAMITEAKAIAAHQAALRETGQPLIKPADVVRRLISAAQGNTKVEGATERQASVLTSNGRPVFKVEQSGKSVSISPTPDCDVPRDQAVETLVSFLKTSNAPKFTIDFTGIKGSASS